MDAYADLQPVLRKYKHLKIKLEEVKSATDNFNSKNFIGVGGFGKVYKGELTHYKGRSIVAIKRLDSSGGQGTPEFLKEIMMLTRYKHENLISLLGYCHEGKEMILVYEHASRGSLDHHLNSPHLTWSRRIKICLDAAKGLSYLHDPRGTHQRLIHCDIKSGNILLDDQWNAKLSDFGLSIVGSANEQQSLIVTLAAGTYGYIDPRYRMTSTLTKESDVYSFGVVLFEIMCGKLCCIYKDGRLEKNFVREWIESYERQELMDIIFENPTIQPMNLSALITISDIAYRCLKYSREDRPKMAEVVTVLESALEVQVLSEMKLPYYIYKEIVKTAESPMNIRSTVELEKHVSKGFLVNGGKTWLSLNKKGELCEMISFGECVVPGAFESYPWSSEYNSRFVVGTYHSVNGRFRARVRSQFLSPRVTYMVNLVFKLAVPRKARKWHTIPLKYKLQGVTTTSTTYLAYEREDGWLMAELYQLITDQRMVDLEILFNGSDRSFPVIEAEGIEFRPLEVETEDENLEMQSISDSDANWEEKLPIDYEDMINWSANNVQWATKKEAYSIICKGFLINDGQEWFFLDKNGKKCHMLSARAACIEGQMYPYWRSLSKSRFGEELELMHWGVEIKIVSEIKSQLVSPETTYASYLVYKLPKHKSKYEAPVEVVNDDEGDDIWYFHLQTSQIPVIRPKADQNTHSPPFSRPKMKGLPQQRTDGWMEVQIWEFRTTTSTTTEMIPLRLTLTPYGAKMLSALIIQGVEFRPI